MLLSTAFFIFASSLVAQQKTANTKPNPSVNKGKTTTAPTKATGVTSSSTPSKNTNQPVNAKANSVTNSSSNIATPTFLEVPAAPAFDPDEAILVVAENFEKIREINKTIDDKKYELFLNPKLAPEDKLLKASGLENNRREMIINLLGEKKYMMYRWASGIKE